MAPKKNAPASPKPKPAAKAAKSKAAVKVKKEDFEKNKVAGPKGKASASRAKTKGEKTEETQSTLPFVVKKELQEPDQPQRKRKGSDTAADDDFAPPNTFNPAGKMFWDTYSANQPPPGGIIQ